MFRTMGDGPSAWESLLPAEVLRLPEELARVDALLDDPVFFAVLRNGRRAVPKAISGRVRGRREDRFCPPTLALERAFEVDQDRVAVRLPALLPGWLPVSDRDTHADTCDCEGSSKGDQDRGHRRWCAAARG
jgi:hypothetical protein